MTRRRWALALVLATALGTAPLGAQVTPPLERGSLIPERPESGPFSNPDLYPDSVPRLLGFVFIGGPLYSGSWRMNHAIGLVGRYRLSERLTASARGQFEMSAGFREAVRFLPALDIGYALSPNQSEGVFELKSGTALLDGKLYWTAGVSGLARPLGPQGIGFVMATWFDTRFVATGTGVGIWATFGLGFEFPELKRKSSSGSGGGSPG